MTIKEKEECAICFKHGNCAVESAGGHSAILNETERAKLLKLYNLGLPVIADADMKYQGFVKNDDGKWVVRSTPLTEQEKYEAAFSAVNIIVNLSRLLEPILEGAVERVENEYYSKHNLATERTVVH